MSDITWTDKDLGVVSAFGVAKEHGWTGTEEEWEALQAAAPQAGSDAEAYGAGTRSGTAVGSADPAYQNNAKYYKEQAAGSATAAAASASEAAQYTSDAVHTWLDANIDPDSGYALDRTLTEPLEAAPADLVGDLKSAIDGIREHTKNLFEPSNILPAYFTASSTYVKSNDSCALVFIPCETSKTYTVSKTAGTRFSAGYTKAFPVAGASSSTGTAIYGVEVNNSGSSITITTGEDAQYIVAWVWNSGTDTITKAEMLASVQIELGSSASSYEPPYSAIDRVIRNSAITYRNVLETGTDLNNVRKPTGYYVLGVNSQYDHMPTEETESKRRMLFCCTYGDYSVQQILFNITDGIIYQRLYTNNAWSDWKSTRDDMFVNFGTLANGTDLNTLYGKDGFYTMGVNSEYEHDPVGSLSRRLLLCYTSGGTFTHQIMLNSATGDIYQRVYASSAWSAWKQLPGQLPEICGRNIDRICTSHAGVFTNSKYQNSPKAFKDARKLGIMYQELDVVFTKDLVPVLAHSSFAENAMDASTTPPTPITSEFKFKDYTLEQLKENYVFGDTDYYWTILTLAEAYSLLTDLGCRIIVDVGGGYNNPTGSRELLCSYMIENGIQCEGLITSECTGDYEHDTFGILCETGGEKFPLGVVIANTSTDSYDTAVAKINAILSAKESLNLDKAWCFIRRERAASDGDLISFIPTLLNAGIKIAGYSYTEQTYNMDIPTFFSLVISATININYLRYLDAIAE